MKEKLNHKGKQLDGREQISRFILCIYCLIIITNINKKYYKNINIKFDICALLGMCKI